MPDLDYKSLESMPSVSDSPEESMPLAPPTEEDAAMSDIPPELRTLGKQLGFDGAKIAALKEFIHACVDASEDGEYDGE